ncbi:kinase-like domain-containing protein [Rhizoctonia solani]|nr:kinase-like domain-containing protein [Rhizoctonia solani]
MPVTSSPPRLQKLPYHAWPTRLEKEQQAAGRDICNLPSDLAEIGPWILGDMIGKGSSGRVKLGKHKYSGKMAAIKIISKNPVLTSKQTLAEMDARHQKQLQGIHREIVIMKLINHPCIMALYDLQETETELYVRSSVDKMNLMSAGRLPESEALFYFKQILYGLDYCHRFNISHRDLKPENILLDKNMNIKIADFGMAALEVANGMLETSCGSPHYASPEIVAGKAYHGASSDIWSCGVVLYALLTSRLPFDDPDIRVLLHRVKVGKFRMHDCISPLAQDLLKRMLVVDPERRITIRQIFKHPFFNGQTNRLFINPPPPSLKELSLPIGQSERIERAYLDNLVLLFHKSPTEIAHALRAMEPSWEKAFLYLLRQYADRVRENYGEDGEDEYSAPMVFADVTNSAVARRRKDMFAKPRLPPGGGIKMERSDRPRPLSLGGHRDELRTPRMRWKDVRRNRDEVELRGPRHSRDEPTTSRYSREESSRRPRPPSVIGPRPNPPTPSKIRTAPVSPSRISATRPAPAPHPTSAMAVRPTPEAPKPPVSRQGSHLNPMAQAFESVFQDVVLGPEPFKSVLSPDVDGAFAVGRRWSGEDKSRDPASEDFGRSTLIISQDQNREVAKHSTLSPHAEPFILGSLGQPAVKPARKGKPAPLSLNNPNWQAVSSVSQPGTPYIDSPKNGQQPKVTGWFTNLFTFKPVYHVLYSTASIELTARECTRVLTTFGIQVLKVQGQDLLRCNLERFHDLDGLLIAKPVKFRIEVKSNSRILDSPRLDVPGTPLTATSTTSPYPCVLVMTQEKGAHSTLKAVYARLRAMWKLDALVSPMPATPVIG